MGRYSRSEMSAARMAALRSPRDPVILAVVAGATPQRSVLLIEVDRGDRAGVLFHKFGPVSHPREFSADPGGNLIRQRDPTRLGLVIAERTAHLVAGDVRRFTRLLHRHVEFDDVQKELQKILVLRVSTLNGKAEEQLAIL